MWVWVGHEIYFNLLISFHSFLVTKPNYIFTFNTNKTIPTRPMGGTFKFGDTCIMHRKRVSGGYWRYKKNRQVITALSKYFAIFIFRRATRARAFISRLFRFDYWQVSPLPLNPHPIIIIHLSQHQSQHSHLKKWKLQSLCIVISHFDRLSVKTYNRYTCSSCIVSAFIEFVNIFTNRSNTFSVTCNCNLNRSIR